MTMVKKAKSAPAPEASVPAGEFKVHCLALLDRVAESGVELVVTKRGKPVARLVPVAPPPGLRGSILWQGDVLSPIGEAWEAER
jgi:prevent-host-death family protein